MEYQQKEWSMGQQLIRAFLWEAKRLFYKLYIPAGIYLCVMAVIWLLPKEACDYVRIHAVSVFYFANLFFIVGLQLGLCLLPYAVLAAPYGEAIHPLEKNGDLSEAAVLAARILLCIVLAAVLIWMGMTASGLMEKFAGETNAWFQVEFVYFDSRQKSQGLIFTLRFWKQIVCIGVLQPMAFFWIFLRRLYRNHERQYVSSYILALLLNAMLMTVAELQFVHLAPGKELPVWIQAGVWMGVVFGSVYVFFRDSVKLGESGDY